MTKSESEEKKYKCPHCNEEISFVWYGYEFEQYCPCCYKKISKG